MLQFFILKAVQAALDSLEEDNLPIVFIVYLYGELYYINHTCLVHQHEPYDCFFFKMCFTIN